METLQDTIDSMLNIDGIKTDGHTIESSSIEVGGVKVVQIKDKKGRVWSVPADDNNFDDKEYGLRNILEIPKPEPGFFYQYVGSDRLNEYLSRDFALVEPEEVGLPAYHSDPSRAADAQLGTRPTAHHQVGQLHLVKIPKLIEARYRRASKMRADEAIAGIKQPRHLGKVVKQIDETDVQVHSRETTEVKGEPIVTSASGFKEYNATPAEGKE